MPSESRTRIFDQAQRGLRALLHHVAELAREDQLARCRACGVASMKRMSPPTGVHARPVATPGTLVRIATSSLEARRAQDRVRRHRLDRTFVRPVALPRCASATLRSTAPICALEVAARPPRACSRVRSSLAAPLA